MNIKKFLFLIVLVLSFPACSNAAGNEEFVIKTGMNLDSAEAILRKVKAKDTSDYVQKVRFREEGRAYTLNNDLWLFIGFNPDNKIISGMGLNGDFRGMPGKSLCGLSLEKINVKTPDDIKKCILEADKEAQRIIAEFNRSKLAKESKVMLSLELYDLTVIETEQDSRDVAEVRYQTKALAFRGHPQHFTIWVYKDNLATKAWEGK